MVDGRIIMNLTNRRERCLSVTWNVVDDIPYEKQEIREPPLLKYEKY